MARERANSIWTVAILGTIVSLTFATASRAGEGIPGPTLAPVEDALVCVGGGYCPFAPVEDALACPWWAAPAPGGDCDRMQHDIPWLDGEALIRDLLDGGMGEVGHQEPYFPVEDVSLNEWCIPMEQVDRMQRDIPEVDRMQRDIPEYE
ncbi:MAG: hypothetical protein ACE5O2_02855 [Armatimonadota bacterium]